MKIAIILPRIAQMGPVIVMQNLVNNLLKYSDLNVRVFYLGKTVDPEVKMMVRPEKLTRRNFHFSDFDVVHTSGIRPDLFACLFRSKIKFHISTIHSYVFDDLTFSYNRVVSLLFGKIWLMIWRKADILVCVSNALGAYYSGILTASCIKVIHNGISEPYLTFIPDRDIIHYIETFHSRGMKVIGCAGRLTKIKGIDIVLKMIALEKDYAVVIIGDGKEYSDLESLSIKLKITHKCVFCGFRSYASGYFRYFDLFVVPSRSEGFGLTLIEAVQNKVPVVCSDLSVFQELFNEEEVTFFKLKDISSLSTALRIAIQSGSKKSSLALTKYTDKYSANLMADRYYRLYNSKLQYV